MRKIFYMPVVFHYYFESIKNIYTYIFISRICSELSKICPTHSAFLVFSNYAYLGHQVYILIKIN